MAHDRCFARSWSTSRRSSRRSARRLADVVGYSFALANELGIDLSSAIRAKMVKNAIKYPADKYRGRYGPEDDGRRR